MGMLAGVVPRGVGAVSRDGSLEPSFAEKGSIGPSGR